jgi:ABC-type multidrug transport system ATPase subunit
MSLVNTIPAVEFRHLSKSYGDFSALSNINLQIAAGEVIVICGLPVPENQP